MKKIYKAYIKKVLSLLGIEEFVNSLYRKLLGYFVNIKYRKVKKFELNIQGITVVFSTEDSCSRRWFYRYDSGKIHEEKVVNLLAEKLKPSKCFVDVGAYLGYYTCLASKLMPDGIVYAFEMDELNYALLAKNLKINECMNVNIYHAAVTDSPGVVSYVRHSKYPNPTCGLYTSVPPVKYGQVISVQAVTLDSFFKDKESIPDVIKIDVEGAEMKVLNGMQNILEGSKVKLFVEVHPVRLLSFQLSPNAVISMLFDKGYDVFEIENMRESGKDISLRKLNRESELKYNTILYCAPSKRL